MKTFNIILISFILASFLCPCSCSGEEPVRKPIDIPPVSGDGPDGKDEFRYVYRQGESGFEVYRIPATVKTVKGTLLAFAEARRSRINGDTGDIDMVVKRSSDDGKTWSKMTTVWDDGDNTCGNPVPIVDDKGNVHLLMCWNYKTDKWGTITAGSGVDTRRVYYTCSKDDGLTWDKPVEITSSVKDASWLWYGTGPCHGIQISDGPYKGRLVSPDYHTTLLGGKSISWSHIIYSDDYGKTWKRGGTVPESGVGECSVAALPDGRLVLNMRASDGYFRKQSFSDDGGLTWTKPVPVQDQIDCKCQGSIIASGTSLLLSNAASASERVCMTVSKSVDGGVSWTARYLVYPGKSGYSDLVMLSDTQVAVFYEGGAKRYTDGLDFKIIDLKDII